MSDTTCARQANAFLDALRQNIAKVMVGKDEAVEMLLTALICGGHVLIEDLPGLGKTTLASALAKSLSCSFKRIQFTPDVLPSDVTGFTAYNLATGEKETRFGAVMAQMVLADEINRTSPKTQSSLLEVMQERQVTIDGETYPLPEPFMVLATQNPSELTGTYPLPEAQLDRFAIRISMGYPTEAEEISILSGRRGKNPLESVRPVTDVDTLREIRAVVAQVKIDEAVCRYIVNLIQATRNNRSLSLGASPRASIMLMKLSQAYAFLRGRDYVIPDDAAFMYAPAVAHRLLLSQEARLSRASAKDILSEILRSAPVPYKGAR